MSIRIHIVAAFMVAVAAPLPAQRPLNLDFELLSVSSEDKPWGWTHGWSPFASSPVASFALDSTVRVSGKRSLRIESAAATSSPITPQTIVLQVPAGFAHGKGVALSARIRGAALQRRAFVTLEAWGNNRVISADTAVLRGTAARLQWTTHALGITPDTAAHSLVITAGLEGSGAAWFDDFRLTVDGALVSSLPTGVDPSFSDLQFLATLTTPLRTALPPIAGTTPDDYDLGRFASIVGDARVVGLGESTHGTREFFLVKHRLLEYLVRQRGFSVFAIEANQLAVETINRYVQGGSGTAAEVMRVMFRVWNTEEMQRLIEWMRQHNAAYPQRRVRFVGYDMQDHRRPADTLQAFLQRTEPALQSLLDSLDAYRAERSWSTPRVEAATRTQWRRAADALFAAMSARRIAWLGSARHRDDTLRVEWAIQAANLLRQAALVNEALNVPDRDSLMAANIDWALRVMVPNERAVVWAHDIHVSRGGDSARSFYNGKTMGAQLSRIYGAAYRAFSLLTYEGAYSATRSLTDYTMVEATALPAVAGSMERALHLMRRPVTSVGLTVDLRTMRGDANLRWLERPRRLRHVGYAAYDFAFDLEAVFPLEFDGVIFIDRTTASRLVR